MPGLAGQPSLLLRVCSVKFHERIFAAGATKTYTSNDSGTTFTTAFDSTGLSFGGGSFRVGGAFFDGSNVWIGSNAGLLYSSNGGDNFSIVSTVSGLAGTEAIVALVGGKDPSGGAIRFYIVTANTSAVTASALISSIYSANPQIYRLDWGGTSWTNLFSNTVRNGIATGDTPGPIAMARNDINIVYVAANRPGGTYPDRRATYKLPSPDISHFGCRRLALVNWRMDRAVW